MTSKPNPQPVGWFRFVLSFLLSVGAAYAFSFAVDILVAVLVRAYPATASVAVCTWSAIAIVLSFVSLLLARYNRWASMPYAIFGLLAIIGGVVAANRRDFVIAGAMFFQAFAVWCATKPSAPKEEPVVDARRHRSITSFRNGSHT